MRKIKISFLLMLSITLFSCSDEKKQLFYVKDGLIYEKSTNELYTGTIKDSVLDKILEYDVIKGIKEGRFNIYYKNGSPETIGIMKDNRNEGKWAYYYPNGQIESEGFFKNDVAEGKWNWYFEDGNLKESGVFQNGKREGEWLMFNRNGEIIEQANFINGAKAEDNKIL